MTYILTVFTDLIGAITDSFSRGCLFGIEVGLLGDLRYSTWDKLTFETIDGCPSIRENTVLTICRILLEQLCVRRLLCQQVSLLCISNVVRLEYIKDLTVCSENNHVRCMQVTQQYHSKAMH